jgi:hypothetical protein
VAETADVPAPEQHQCGLFRLDCQRNDANSILCRTVLVTSIVIFHKVEGYLMYGWQGRTTGGGGLLHCSPSEDTQSRKLRNTVSVDITKSKVFPLS